MHKKYELKSEFHFQNALGECLPNTDVGMAVMS